MQDTELDQTDRQLLTALTADGRASITTLAATLGLARATVQTRLEKLQGSGVIRRFTVELSAQATPDLVHAVMLIQLQGAQARRIAKALRAMPEITDLHSTNGSWDLVARIETATLPDFDRVLRRVREIDGVLNSETCLLLDRA